MWIGLVIIVAALLVFGVWVEIDDYKQRGKGDRKEFIDDVEI